MPFTYASLFLGPKEKREHVPCVQRQKKQGLLNMIKREVTIKNGIQSPKVLLNLSIIMVSTLSTFFSNKSAFL